MALIHLTLTTAQGAERAEKGLQIAATPIQVFFYAVMLCTHKNIEGFNLFLTDFHWTTYDALPARYDREYEREQGWEAGPFFVASYDLRAESIAKAAMVREKVEQCVSQDSLRSGVYLAGACVEFVADTGLASMTETDLESPERTIQPAWQVW